MNEEAFAGITAKYFDKDTGILATALARAESAKKTLNDIITQGLYDENSEVYKAAVEEYTASITAYYDSLEEALTAAQDQFLNTLDKETRAFEKSLTGGVSFNRAKEDWDWRKRMDEKYLDEINTLYQKSALAYEYDSAIRATASVKAQQKLNEAKEEELRILNEKDKLTQYDLDRAKLRLDITKAEIALEEA
jgi:hypothetical protein